MGRLQENIVVMLLIFIDFLSFHFHFACNFCVSVFFFFHFYHIYVRLFFSISSSFSLSIFIAIQYRILIIKTSFTRLQSFTFNSSKTACSVNAIASIKLLPKGSFSDSTSIDIFSIRRRL